MFTRVLPIVAASLLVFSALWARPVQAQDIVQLPVRVVSQETPVWCWAASSEMVLNYLGYPNANPAGDFQCGIVAVTFPECDLNCFQCIAPIGPLPNGVDVLKNYINYSNRQGFYRDDIRPRYVANPTFGEIRDAIDRGYPIIAGISPQGPPSNPAFTAHAVVITGYIDRGYSDRAVIVNDPLIFQYGYANPYDVPGSAVADNGKAVVGWNVFLNGLNFTAAILMNPVGSDFYEEDHYQGD